MDEIKNLKRLMSLSEEETKELEEHESDYFELARKVVKTYDSFENGKVRAGRLKTLLGNIRYKINFSYNELYKTSVQLRETFTQAEKDGVKINEALAREIEEFLSQNSEKKELPIS